MLITSLRSKVQLLGAGPKQRLKGRVYRSFFVGAQQAELSQDVIVRFDHPMPRLDMSCDTGVADKFTTATTENIEKQHHRRANREDVQYLPCYATAGIKLWYC